MTTARGLVLTLACLIGLPLTALSEEFSPFQEMPITLSAAQTLPEGLQKGPNFQVEDAIINDGLINTYYLQTDYGKLKIVSNALYLERINELRALEHMEKLEQTEEFGEALKKGAKAPIETVKSIATTCDRCHACVRHNFTALTKQHHVDACRNVLETFSSLKCPHCRVHRDEG